MLEKILLILAALIVIFIAGLLVQKQNKCKTIRENLEEDLIDSFEDIKMEVSSLINEDPPDDSISYLEKRVDMLLKCLQKTEHIKYKEQTHHDKFKRKKSFRND